ncbi:anti-repressor SinI family protein [Fervidibacillus albus]|uniref:Anti-repressor SinI family protein n=1 Tax=Fervidibacillus albus TaxID=2980026 RepID=A0A9E8LSV2_9BACI|nr:anti-repressor SinI family protein [Fervidibacillus albus]WAA08980.1 anti-repressor SinI family protein [Fervidibacillus albus]
MVEKSQVTERAQLQKTTVIQKYLDPEWVELIKEAKRYGMTIDEIRKFLTSFRKKSPTSKRSESVR